MLPGEGLGHWIYQGMLLRPRARALRSDQFRSTVKQPRSVIGSSNRIRRMGRGSGMDFTHGMEFTVGRAKRFDVGGFSEGRGNS